MEKLVLIGGKAGQGVGRTSIILGKSFTTMGYYVFNYRDYQSLIRGGHNFNILKISNRPVYSHENFYDIIIALDKRTIELHRKDLNKNGFVLCDKSLNGDVRVDVQGILKKLGAAPIIGNNVLLGSLFKTLGLPLQPLLNVIEKEFGKHILQAVKAGYEAVEKRMKLFEPEGKKIRRYFLSGSEAVAYGAIAAGLDVYFAYPMTPATSVLHILATKQSEHNIAVIQLENEIAVVNAALGASYAGATVMVGSSGGGFALMTEALSLQGMSELPLVVYLAQRPAPSTGVPTYTAQGDLKFAINAGHGEFPRVVVAPGDAKEAFYRTIEAFYLAQKYRVLSIVLSDKQLAESNYSFDNFEKPIKTKRFLVKPSSNYKSYEITKTGISPRAVPGQTAFVRASSYEHDDYGYTTESSRWIVKMNEKRLRKMKCIEEEINKLQPITVYGKGKNLIIGWGSTKGAILDALSELHGFRFMQVSYISPFPTARVKEEIESSKNVLLIENNATGLLGQIIAEKTGCFIDKLLKYDGRPFTSKDVIIGVKRNENL